MSGHEFSLAQRLAYLESDLDDARFDLPEPVRMRACVVLLEMHALAGDLAGDRIGEIYNQEDEPCHAA